MGVPKILSLEKYFRTKAQRRSTMIRNITVYIDNSKMEFADRVRCGFIVSEDYAGRETFHTDLIDQYEYPTIKDLVDDIVGIFHVSRYNVLVTM